MSHHPFLVFLGGREPAGVAAALSLGAHLLGAGNGPVPPGSPGRGARQGWSAMSGESPVLGDVTRGCLEGDDPVAAVVGEPQRAGPGVDGAQPVAPAD